MPRIREPLRRLGTAALQIELFVVATTSLWVLELKLLSAITVATILACLTVTGQRIIEWSGARESGIGVGLVVGCCTYALFAQLLLFLGISHAFAHWVAVAVPLGFALLSSRVQTDDYLSSSNVVYRLPFSALAIGLLVVALRHTWLMPFSLGVAIYERTRSSVNLQPQRRILSLITVVVGAVSSIYLRPNRWWYFYQGNDAQFFESLNWSIARWGVFEHPGLSGGSIAGYHWLAYAFFGGLGEAARLQPWDGLLKIGILLIPSTLALLILESPRNRKRSLAVSQGPIVLLVVAATPLTRVDSFTFSILVSFAFIILSEIQFDQRRRMIQIALFVLMSTALLFTKVSTAAIVGAILTVTIVFQMIRRKQVSFVPTLSLAGVFVVLYLWLLRQSDAQTLLVFQVSITASSNSIRSLLENPYLSTNLLALIILWIGSEVSEGQNSSVSRAILGVALFSLTLQFAVVGPTSLYFGLPALYFFNLYATRQRSVDQELQFFASCRTKRLIPPLVLLGAIAAGFGISSTLNRIDLRFQLTERFGAWLLDIVRGSGLTLSIIALLFFAAIRIEVRRSLLYAIAILTGLGVFSGQLMSSFRQAATWGAGIYTSSGVNSAAFGSGGLDEVSRYVRRTTAQETILASNNFCCFGESWFSGTEARDFRGPGENWEQALGGANYLLPANTQRRFLLQGLRFQTGYRPPTADQINRMRLSLRFANRPTRRDVDELKSYGVSGFIVNLSLTSHRDWSDFAFERFRSDDFVYLELK